jgi:predicted peptidase
MTGGSYISEASSLEIINWILTNYSIDRNRLYLIGYSNGAYAVFALAQSLPDLAAVIYPVGGLSEKELTMNLSNITVIQPVSRKDNIFRGNINAVKNSLQRYGNYRQYKFDGLTHIHLDPYQYHRGSQGILK